jgi:hypothetical protein
MAKMGYHTKEAKAGHKENMSKKHHEAESKGMKKHEHKKEHHKSKMMADSEKKGRK